MARSSRATPEAPRPDAAAAPTRPRRAAAPARGRGRPRIELPPAALDLLDVLAQVRCPVHEIGAHLRAKGYRISTRTLERNYAARIKEGWSAAQASLRRAQFATALAGNATMQIWLGKQLLDQTDKERDRRPDPEESSERAVRQYTLLFGQRIEF